VNAKDRRHSNRTTFGLAEKYPIKDLIAECLEPQEEYNFEWGCESGWERDGSRLKCMYCWSSRYYLEEWAKTNEKLRKLTLRRKAMKLRRNKPYW